MAICLSADDLVEGPEACDPSLKKWSSPVFRWQTSHMPMLLPLPLSRFVCIEVQYRSLSIKRLQQDATGLGLSAPELLPSHWKRHQQRWLCQH